MNTQQQNLFDSSPPDAPQTRKQNTPHSEQTREARGISYDEIKGKRSKRHRLILQVLADYGPQTAREVLRRLIEQGHLPPQAERNATSPRLSECAEAGLVETLEELRTVGNDAPASVWKITERGILLLEHLREEAQKDA